MSIDPRVKALAPDADPELVRTLTLLLNVLDAARLCRFRLRSFASGPRLREAGADLDAAIVAFTERHP